VRKIKLSQATRSLAEYAADLGDEIVILTEGNKPVAAIVPIKETDRESLVLSGHPEFLRLVERSRAEFREGRTLSLEDMKQAFPAKRSPNRRLQPTKARRQTVTKRRSRRRLRG
jgi:antitoxin (DNA-binding transcriptional repressor) of toxin-antitoxin stability system